MKNLKLLIENFNLFLEATNKPFQGLWQEIFFQEHGIKEYKDMTEEQKKDFEQFKEHNQKIIDSNLDQFDNTTQMWIGNVFKNKQQKYPEDLDKLVDMVKQFNVYKKKTGLLTKVESDLQKHTYLSLTELLARLEDENANYGENEIIYDKKNWKIIKLTEYEKAKVLIDNNQNSWCVKREYHFKQYGAPFYAFYKDDKPYALYHYKSFQLKNSSDQRFDEIDPDFEKVIEWLFFDYLKYSGGDTFQNVGDLEVLFNNEKIRSLFSKRSIKQWAKSKHKMQLFYSLLTPEEIDNSEYGKFHQAIVHDDIETVKKCLDKGMVYDGSPREKHYDDYAWEIAIYSGSLKSFKAMVEHGLNINVINLWLYTPLMKACFYRKLNIVEYILSFPNIEINKTNHQNRSALTMACLEGDARIVELLLNYPNIDINTKDGQNGYTPLMDASYYGYDKIVKLLLDKKDIDVNIFNHLGHSAFSMAVKQGNLKVVQLLLKVPNIDINIIDKDGKSVLKFAYDIKNMKLIELLIKTPNINVNIYDLLSGETLLLMACANGEENIVKLLLQNSKTDVNKSDKYNYTPLMTAIYQGNVNIVKMLLDHPEIKINEKAHNDKTALYKAVEDNKIEIVKLLLNHKDIDPNIPEKWNKDSPLITASKNREMEPIIKLLLAHPKIDVNYSTNFHETALIDAIRFTQVNNVKLLLAHPKIEINLRNYHKQTPLGVAIFEHSRKGLTASQYIVNLLKERGAKE